MKIVCTKMRYSIEPSDRIYVKGYWFLSFAKTMGKSLSNRYAKIYNRCNKNSIKKRNLKNSKSNW